MLRKLFKSLSRALSALSAFAANTSGQALATGDWEVINKLIGEKDKKTGETKTTKNMSGIACATAAGFPRICLVVDDEIQSAQVVTLTEGRIEAGDLIPLISDMFDGLPVELDGEGVAFADNFFYVIGSHGKPRRKKENDPAKEDARVAAVLKASSNLLRLPFDPVSGKIGPAAPPSTALAALIAAEPALAGAQDKILEEGGVTVEGIAVRERRLFAGFRGPLVGDKAVILSAALGHFFDGQAADARLHVLPLGEGRGVRDLASYENGILILAGPMADVDGVYSVYWWDGFSPEVKFLKDLPAYIDAEKKAERDAGKKVNIQWKPEALLPLDRDADGLRVLLLLDGAKKGGPRTERVPYPR